MKQSRFIYVGTDQEGEGSLLVYALGADGSLGLVQRCLASHPTYLAISRDEKRLYSIENKTQDGKPSGAYVTAWSIDHDTGKLDPVNRVAGSAPRAAHIGIAPADDHLFVSNYGAGTLDVFSLTETGAIAALEQTIRREGSGPHPRQTQPHPHMAIADPGHIRVVTADLGLDSIELLALRKGRFDTEQIIKVEPGNGLRHCVFHPVLHRLYVCAELASRVFVFAYSTETGAIGGQQQVLSTTGLPFEQSDVSGITTDTQGAWLAVGNRKMSGSGETADSIAVFGIDTRSGLLLPPEFITEGVECPRALAFDPNGQHLFVANQKGNTVTSYHKASNSDRFQLVARSAVPCPMGLAFKA